MFDVTQTSSSNVVLLPFIKQIQQVFGIDWPSVEWQDLTTPLYSAIAARLYVMNMLRSNTAAQDMPVSIADQATFWQANYRPEGIPSDFIQATAQLDIGKFEALIYLIYLRPC